MSFDALWQTLFRIPPSASTLALFAAALYFATWLLALAGRTPYVFSPTCRKTAISTGILFVILMIVIGPKLYRHLYQTRATVITETAVLSNFAGGTEQFRLAPGSEVVLHKSETFRLNDREETWIYLETSNGQTGWTEETTLKRLPKR